MYFEPTPNIITIQKADLLRLVEGCKHAVDKKSRDWTHKEMYIWAEPPKAIAVNSKDRDIAIQCNGTVKVEESWDAVLPCDELHKAIKAMPSGPIHLTIPPITGNNMSVVVSSDSSPTKIPIVCQHWENEFPIGDPVVGGESSIINTELLIKLLDSTYSAVCRRDDGNVGCGFRAQDGNLLVITHDKHRIAIAEAKDCLQPFTTTMMLPAKAFHALRKLCDCFMAASKKARKAPIGDVYHANGRINFLLGDFEITVKQSQYRFPTFENYLDGIDDLPPATLRHGSLLTALKEIAASSKAKDQNALLKIENGILTLTADVPGVGEIKKTIKVEFDCPKMEVTLNVSYIIDGVAAMDCDLVNWWKKPERTDPLVMKPWGESEDWDYSYIVMPIRTWKS
ncbi:MAG: DNA polymerase III subunit beta [Polyangiaceae bacterium]|nr:DNA polymerase III subunit beta [Polyangiaceae bacterium]